MTALAPLDNTALGSAFTLTGVSAGAWVSLPVTRRPVSPLLMVRETTTPGSGNYIGLRIEVRRRDPNGGKTPAVVLWEGRLGLDYYTYFVLALEELGSTFDEIRVACTERNLSNAIVTMLGRS